MKWIILLSVFLILGVGVNADQNETILKQYPDCSLSLEVNPPIIIEAEIVGSHGGSKYHWYDVVPQKVIKNELKEQFASKIKVAINSSKKIQLKKQKTYILGLAYYNESHLEHGLKIVNMMQCNCQQTK